MLQTLRLRVLAWMVGQRPTECDECGEPLEHGRAVDVEWCSQNCANLGWERKQI